MAGRLTSGESTLLALVAVAVRNIYKYYVTYRLTVDAQETRRKALEELKKGAR